MSALAPPLSPGSCHALRRRRIRENAELLRTLGLDALVLPEPPPPPPPRPAATAATQDASSKGSKSSSKYPSSQASKKLKESTDGSSEDADRGKLKNANGKKQRGHRGNSITSTPFLPWVVPRDLALRFAPVPGATPPATDSSAPQADQVDAKPHIDETAIVMELTPERVKSSLTGEVFIVPASLGPSSSPEALEAWWRDSAKAGDIVRVLVAPDVWRDATLEPLALPFASGSIAGAPLAVEAPHELDRFASCVPKLHHEFHGSFPWVLDPLRNAAPQFIRNIAVKLNLPIDRVIELCFRAKRYPTNASKLAPADAAGTPFSSSCHWCRQHTFDLKSQCPRCCSFDGVGTSPPGQLCGPCLYNRWGLDIIELLENPKVCPYCRDQCNCSAGCLASRPGGLNNTVRGQEIGKAAKKSGSGTINAYLAKHHGVVFGAFEHHFRILPDGGVEHSVQYPDGRRVVLEGKRDRNGGFFRVPSHLYEPPSAKVAPVVPAPAPVVESNATTSTESKPTPTKVQEATSAEPAAGSALPDAEKVPAVDKSPTAPNQQTDLKPTTAAENPNSPKAEEAEPAPASPVTDPATPQEELPEEPVGIRNKEPPMITT